MSTSEAAFKEQVVRVLEGNKQNLIELRKKVEENHSKLKTQEEQEEVYWQGCRVGTIVASLEAEIKRWKT
jgi:hypothetical protein